MKTELMNISGKGICIVISDINPNDLVLTEGKPLYSTGVFEDIHIIADCLRSGMKINAIKEVRSQTGWGLKQAKQYVDKYTENGSYYNSTIPSEMHLNGRNADRFIKDHTPLPPIDLIDDDEFKI